MIAGSDPGHYGELKMFVTPRDNPPNGPAIVAAKIDAHPNISSQITLLNQNGSSVLLGNLLQIPVAGVAALHPAALRRVVAQPLPRAATGRSRQYGNQPATIGNTLADALGDPVPGAGPSTATGPAALGSLSPQARALLNQAQAAYTQAQADLKAGNLGAYQNDINNLESSLQQVQALTGGTSASTTTTTTTNPATGGLGPG